MSTRETRILRLPEVMRLTGLGKTTIHRRYRAGTFPRPLRLGPKSIGWQREEILEWLESLPRAGAETGDVEGADRDPGRRADCARGSGWRPSCSLDWGSQ